MGESPPGAVRRRRTTGALFAVAGTAMVAGLVWSGLTLATGRVLPYGSREFVAVTGTEPATASATTATSTPAATPGDPADGARLAETFLAAWEAGDHAAMQSLVLDRSDDLVQVYGDLDRTLGVVSVVARPGEFDARALRLAFTVDVELRDVGPVSWSGTVPVVDADDGWRVLWTPAVVHPALSPDRRLEVRSVASRGRLLDRTGRPLADDPDLLLALVGEVGVTGQGTSGLQWVLDAELRGPSTAALVLVDTGNGAVAEVIRARPPDVTPPDVPTTLDLEVQAAAAAALAGVPGRSAVVAVQVSTGGVLAVADSPVGGRQLSINGSYPPGSVFGVVTAAAAIRAGIGPDAPVDCPGTGPTTLAEAFADGCDGAFAALATGLPAGAIVGAADSLGFGSGSPLVLASVSGAVPPLAGTQPTTRGNGEGGAPGDAGSGAAAGDSADVADVAAVAVGEGGVTASPLHMATVAAAVADGQWRRPGLIACAACETRPLPEAPVLRTLMARAVTTGQVSDLAVVPGEPVHATAGTASSPGGAVHAWAVGWQGDVAFAVFLENGGTPDAAVPVASRFLTTLAG